MIHKTKKNKNKKQNKRKRKIKKQKQTSRKIRFTKKKCRELLSKKIKLNMIEYKKGKWVSRAQAIAVSYRQITKKYPKCKRFFNKK